MKNKGFTLIELLVVIAILGLLIVITVPASNRIMRQAKIKSYNTKVDLIEKEAVLYGESNISYLKEGLDLTTKKTSVCTFGEGENPTVSYTTGLTYQDSLLSTYPENSYLCIKITPSDLATSNYINYDVEDFCSNNKNCNAANKTHYDKQIKNLVDDSIINYCNIYIYYKNNRSYAYFDKTNCDKTTTSPQDAYSNGYSYNSVVWSK